MVVCVHSMLADEQSNASPEGLTRALEEISRNEGRPCRLAVDAVRGILRELRRLRSHHRNLTRPPDTLFACAACTGGCTAVSLDGCFKLWQQGHAAKYHCEREPVLGKPGETGSLYADPKLVSETIAACEKDAQKNKDEFCGTCGTSDVDALRHKTHAPSAKMAVDGSYFACCAHSLFLKAFDFKGGERHSFAVALYLLLNEHPAIVCGDTLCQAQARFKHLGKGYKDGRLDLPAGVEWKDVDKVHFAVNAMHVQGVSALAITH